MQGMSGNRDTWFSVHWSAPTDKVTLFVPRIETVSCVIPGQIGAGTLVSSQERRALAVLQIKNFVPPPVYLGFRLYLLSKNCPGQCLRFAGA